MARATVAIEGQLSPYSRLLQEAGYDVIPLNDQALHRAQAIVVQGTDNNFLGMEDPLSKAPVINADGMTPNQVLDAVSRRALARG
ncbi:YkuS family protein [Sulfobacillus harzensis]|uniref:YkuS family protein n=1 Tax=Sulfobacillus harzensis TaxID=2729629 RepID=A0A7Y0L234_9FIRM|nr:YkuS family protein [Sulfobacillus harzensis]NMP21311.1 YkuS family protein [Sulfobacillus harzensis]